VSRYSGMAEVLYAEPNGIVRPPPPHLVPNDPGYRDQWNLRQLNAERTWAIQKGGAAWPSR